MRSFFFALYFFLSLVSKAPIPSKCCIIIEGNLYHGNSLVGTMGMGAKFRIYNKVLRPYYGAIFREFNIKQISVKDFLSLTEISPVLVPLIYPASNLPLNRNKI